MHGGLRGMAVGGGEAVVLTTRRMLLDLFLFPVTILFAIVEGESPPMRWLTPGDGAASISPWAPSVAADMDRRVLGGICKEEIG